MIDKVIMNPIWVMNSFQLSSLSKWTHVLLKFLSVLSVKIYKNGLFFIKSIIILIVNMLLSDFFHEKYWDNSYQGKKEKTWSNQVSRSW